jgi:hypothetical protein
LAEMTRRERIMASARRQRADKLPFFHYWRHCQSGWAERECRNRGMGLNWVRPPYTVRLHGVEVTESPTTKEGKTLVRRTYTTPVGSVFEEEWRDAGVGQWHANRSWRGVTPWLTSHLIKGPEDYRVVKYIVENTEYGADYFPIEQALDWLGEDGVVLDGLPHSPFQMLLIHWVGSEGGRLFYHLADHPELVEDLLSAISKSREPLYQIAARSPAPITLCGDNVDGALIGPRIFERYFLPEYEKQAKILHQQGKLMAVHMDGRLAVLKDLISKTSIDIIEAFHPLPMGDLPLKEALSLWKEKAIWIGFPDSVYQRGTSAIQNFALDLLRESIPGDRIAIAMSTENPVSNQNLITLTSVLEKAHLPLTVEGIEEIGRDIRKEER